MEDDVGNVHLKNLSLHHVANEEDALNLLFMVWLCLSHVWAIFWDSLFRSLLGPLCVARAIPTARFQRRQ